MECSGHRAPMLVAISLCWLSPALSTLSFKLAQPKHTDTQKAHAQKSTLLKKNKEATLFTPRVVIMMHVVSSHYTWVSRERVVGVLKALLAACRQPSFNVSALAQSEDIL
jgi:hypothetical protein